MVVGTALIIVGALIAVIYVVIEVKRMKHKLTAFFLIGLIIFTYFSFTLIIQKQDVELKTVPGMIDGVKLYFSWLGSVFSNFRTITSNAIKMDWSSTNSSFDG